MNMEMQIKWHERTIKMKSSKNRRKGNELKQIEWKDLAYQEMEWVETQGHEMKMQMELKM